MFTGFTQDALDFLQDIRFNNNQTFYEQNKERYEKHVKAPLRMLSDEMIPETHAHGSERSATYALLVGFCIMLVSDVLLG